MTVTDYQTTLRLLAVRDNAFVERALASETANRVESALDERTYAFVRLAVMISVGASVQSLRPIVEAAEEAGATREQIVGTLVAAMPATGVPRIVAAAPTVGLSLDYDVFDALEQPGHAHVPIGREKPR
jgi:alkylhydroperoxidase/carboxymuconolactone decarboxylase family protein YurZ